MRRSPYREALIDVWCCAAVMIKRYGDTADIEAAKRADE
jgi:hypothetical protein